MHVVLPFVAGTTIYTLWRSSRLFVFEWYKAFGLSGWISQMRRLALPYRHDLPSWFLYSLPDALWVYSFTAALALIWAGQGRCLNRLGWLLIPSVLALGGEVGQLLHVVPGTFDWSDVIAYVVAGAVGSLLPNVVLHNLAIPFRKNPYAVAQSS